MAPLSLYSLFHLNLSYSSIEEEQRPDVIRRCYWPILNLARDRKVPVAIEATGVTLEAIQSLDPGWVKSLNGLIAAGLCEFIGSGYVQMIGPLVPAVVNRANLRLGNAVYERLLGRRPAVALVNEQAYSPGLIRHYLETGYTAIITEWDNPHHHHPDWDPQWRYQPQRACGPGGEEIPVLWNKSMAFQKFQRYAHGEMDLQNYLNYLTEHLSEKPRAFPLYGNDAEIFDFRPQRYATEPPQDGNGEWKRISHLFDQLSKDSRFRFALPSTVLKEISGGQRLHLESPEQPVPVKKQGKYNLTRWAVTGRDDLGMNTLCWRLYEGLKAGPGASDADWQGLCGFWSSDYRTHITDRRWKAVVERLRAGVLRREGVERPGSPLPDSVKIEREGTYLIVDTPSIRARLNCRRGLAADKLWFKGISDAWLCGTLPHGYYDDIQWGADFYTGHLVCEVAGKPKVTDLNPAEPAIDYDAGAQRVRVTAKIETPLGPVYKCVGIGCAEGRVDFEYRLDWPVRPHGSLRLGHVTLNPEAFPEQELFYRTHNGGADPETHDLSGRSVHHGAAVSTTVSASTALGVTEGWVELGDPSRTVHVSVEKSQAALIGMIQKQAVGRSYFYRLLFSALEMDETRREQSEAECAVPLKDLRFKVTIKAEGRGLKAEV